MRRISGSPATGTAGFALTSVSGRRRVPRPAVSTSALVTSGMREEHIADRQASPRLVLDVQRAIRGEHVVRWSAPESFDGAKDAGFAAFDFDEGANRRFVDGDDGVAEPELFAHFFVAEPD